MDNEDNLTLTYDEALKQGYEFVYDEDLGPEEGVIPIEDASEYYPGQKLRLLTRVREDEEGTFFKLSPYFVTITGEIVNIEFNYRLHF